jgi:hypothetical protein
MKERDSLEYMGVDGRVILKWICKNRGVEGMVCICMVQNKGQWQDFVNAVLNLGGSQNMTFSLLVEQLLALEEQCSTRE